MGLGNGLVYMPTLEQAFYWNQPSTLWGDLEPFDSLFQVIWAVLYFISEFEGNRFSHFSDINHYYMPHMCCHCEPTGTQLLTKPVNTHTIELLPNLAQVAIYHPPKESAWHVFLNSKVWTIKVEKIVKKRVPDSEKQTDFSPGIWSCWGFTWSPFVVANLRGKTYIKQTRKNIRNYYVELEVRNHLRWLRLIYSVMFTKSS